MLTHRAPSTTAWAMPPGLTARARCRTWAPQTARSHGVSLLEALIALAVMSFGMLALVGVQATMRFNTDVARQRTEATRMAASDVEGLRYFTDVAASATQTTPSWDELTGAAASSVTLPGATGNTTFTLTRTLNTLRDTDGADARFDAAAARVVKAEVQWADRANANHSAVFSSIVVAAAPALSARLSLPFTASAVNRRGGRHVSIPVTAKDLGDGTSAYKPFDQGNSVWVLNNTSGWVTQICTGVAVSQASITSASLTTCSAVQGRLVTGEVQFDLRTGPIDAAVSEQPQGPVLPLHTSTPLQFHDDGVDVPVNQSTPAICVSKGPGTAAEATAVNGSGVYLLHAIPYACVVFPVDTSGWGGRINVVPGDYPDGTAGNWALGTASPHYRVCRYTTAASDYTANADHPKTYCRTTSSTCSNYVAQNLTHQNFLVVRAEHTCPTDAAIDPTTGNLVNSNTRAHQP